MCCICVCCICLVKVVLWVINIVFFFFGGALVGIAFWLWSDDDTHFYSAIGKDSGGALYMGSLYTMMGIGFAMVGVAIIGWFGTCCKSVCLLTIYLICGLVVLLAMGTAFTLSLVYAASVQNPDLENAMLDDIEKKYNTPDNAYITESWDNMQVKMSCCGANNYMDWKMSTHLQSPVPWSCCTMKADYDGINVDNVANKAGCYLGNTDHFHTQGCSDQLSSWLNKRAEAVYITLLVAMCIQLLSLGCGCTTCVRAKNKNDDDD